MTVHQLTSGTALFHGDNRDVLKLWPDNALDSCVTDPPYALVSIQKRYGKGDARTSASLAAHGSQGVSPYMRAAAGFMGQQWDTGEVAFAPEFWAEVFRVLKPGAHLVAFGSSRGYHRMACAIEDAGFEIRDSVMWLYGTGFPKSHSVAKGIDAKLLAGSARTEDMRKLAMGDEYEPSGRGRVNYDHGGGSAMNGTTEAWAPRTPEAAAWEGWGTALKPGFEPIVLARKPLSEGTVAANVLRWGTGALNIDACRIPGESTIRSTGNGVRGRGDGWGMEGGVIGGSDAGRWPANVVHDGSAEVVEAFPNTAPGKSGGKSTKALGRMNDDAWVAKDMPRTGHDDAGGSAARFFYSAKASKTDRAGSKHPTVKPVSLMQWLCRLITPPGGTVLDPFAGSGTTGQAAALEGFRCVLIEREAQYVADIVNRFASPTLAPESSDAVQIGVDSTCDA